MESITIKHEIAKEVNDQLIDQEVITEGSTFIKEWNNDVLVKCSHRRIKKSKMLKIVNIMDASMSIWADSDGIFIRIM